MTTTLTPPTGMTGLACRAWGEIYAVAADWSQASSPVMIHGEDGWTPMGRQVADFRHSPRKALIRVLADALRASMEVDEMLEEDLVAVVDGAWSL